MKLRKSSSAWIIITGVIITGALCLGWTQFGSLNIVSPGLLPAVFALQIITLSIVGYRWHVLLRRLGADLPFGTTMHIHLASRFASVVSPGIAAEAASVGLFRRFTRLSYGQLAGSILLQKFTSFLALAAVFVLVLIFPGDNGIPAAPYVAVLAAGLLLAALVRSLPAGGARAVDDTFSTTGSSGFKSRVRAWMVACRGLGTEALGTSRELLGSREAPLLLVASGVIWALYPLKVYMVTLSLGLQVSFAVVAVSAYTACMAGMIPLLPGGLGSFEAGMTFMLVTRGLTPWEGLMVAVLLRVGTFWIPMLVFAAAAVFMGARLRRSDDEGEALLSAGD